MEQIRDAVASDMGDIARIQAAAMVASDFYDTSSDAETEYRRLLPRVTGYFGGTYHPRHALPERTVIVAARDERLVGFVAAHRSTRRGCTAELQWMFVLPAWQRNGIGTRLLPALARWLKEQQSTRVIIDAPPANPCRAFYLKHGAVPLDEYWLHWTDMGQAFP